MAFHNVPPNGFPDLPDMEEVEAVVKDVATLKTTVSGLSEDVSDLNDTKVNQVTIAPFFSAETAYDVGDLVYYNGLSYRCTTAHEGEWDADDFTPTTIANELKAQSSGVLDYSTTEQATGQKWIDGKDVYFKVYHANALGNNTDVTLEEGFGTTKTLIKTEGVVSTTTEGGKYQYDATYYANSADCAFVCVVQSNLIARARDNYSGYSGDFIVYYTKTEV